MSIVPRLPAFALLAVVYALSLSPAALSAEPLHDGDVGVLTGIYRLPDSTEGAHLVPAGRLAWSMTAIKSSHATIERGPGELLQLDGETTRFEIDVALRASERIEIGLQLPYLRHSSGSLDSLIDSWHSLIGVSGGDRTRQPQDAIGFLYESGDRTLLDVTRASDGIGDLRLYGAWQIQDRPDRRIAIRAGVTLPTGSADQLHGSGGVNWNLGLVADYDLGRIAEGPRLTAFYRAYVNALSEPEFLADIHRDVVGQLSAGFGLELSQRIELRLQAMARSPVYDSAIEILGDPALTLTLGANVTLSPGYVLSLGITEDIKVNSAPDVAFQLGIRYRPSVRNQTVDAGSP